MKSYTEGWHSWIHVFKSHSSGCIEKGPQGGLTNARRTVRRWLHWSGWEMMATHTEWHHWKWSESGWILDLLWSVEPKGFCDRFNVPRERSVRNDFFFTWAIWRLKLPSTEMETSVEGVSLEGWLDTNHTLCVGYLIVSWLSDIQVEILTRELNLGEILELEL